MTTYRVSPTEPMPTHHVLLTDRDGNKVGLILCDDKGDVAPVPQFDKTPVETTALKQTSGSSSYADFDYPYSPIVQDDWSGGRGSPDFERDSTKYYESFRCKSGVANKAYAGPQERYTYGAYSLGFQNMPGHVSWHSLTGTQRRLYYRFTPVRSSFTIGKVWLLVRTIGTPAALTISIYSDTAGALNAKLSEITVARTRMYDPLLSEWLNETIGQAVTSGTPYWLVVAGDAADTAANHWNIGVSPTAGTTKVSGDFDSTPDAATVDLYFRLVPANSAKTCIPFTYKEAQYFVISGASGAPQLFIAGDRGAADNNNGFPAALIDASKSWYTNDHVNSPVQIIAGLGKDNAIPYRTLTANDDNSADLDSAFASDPSMDTTTEYVIHSPNQIEITGHGLTAPVTDVYVSTQDVVYFCMGDSVTVRRMREYNNAGTWTREFADETATTKAKFMTYKPVAGDIVIANDRDTSDNASISVMSNASVPAWGTALAWGTAIPVDSRYFRISSITAHPDSQGNEVTWVLKEDMPYTVDSTGAVKSVNIEEMKAIRSLHNGIQPLRHNVYLYFPMQHGITRYYGSQFDEVGPNQGEALPSTRQGYVVDMAGYPGKFFAAIDAGANGYSCIMDSDGWHERYRAPLGQRITMLYLQVTPGDCLDRLWVYQGNDLIWLPLPSDSANELGIAPTGAATDYPYTHEFAVTLSHMHAGMFDVMKIVKKIKIQSERLDPAGQWFELDYRLEQTTTWTAFTDTNGAVFTFTSSPNQTLDLTPIYGMGAKRFQLRVRGYTTNFRYTPVLLGVIIGAVLKTDVKYIYHLRFRLMDNEPLLLPNTEEETTTAATKLQTVEDFADASNDSMLLMTSTSPLYNNKMVFLNPPTTHQVRAKHETSNPFKRDVFTCTATVQEA